jgi:hypothetical protein
MRCSTFWYYGVLHDFAVVLVVRWDSTATSLHGTPAADEGCFLYWGIGVLRLYSATCSLPGTGDFCGPENVKVPEDEAEIC